VYSLFLDKGQWSQFLPQLNAAKKMEVFQTILDPPTILVDPTCEPPLLAFENRGVIGHLSLSRQGTEFIIHTCVCNRGNNRQHIYYVLGHSKFSNVIQLCPFVRAEVTLATCFALQPLGTIFKASEKLSHGFAPTPFD
jgi:hypothetical protein